MRVIIKTTSQFRNQFADYADPAGAVQTFCNNFAAWKAGLAARPSRGAPQFGKDFPYSFPLVLNRMKLMHVHLIPADAAEREDWMKRFRRDSCSDRTSDKILVYAEDGNKYLLIYILPEGKSHEMAEKARKSPGRERDLFQKFAEIAEDFLTFGKAP